MRVHKRLSGLIVFCLAASVAPSTLRADDFGTQEEIESVMNTSPPLPA